MRWKKVVICQLQAAFEIHDTIQTFDSWDFNWSKTLQIWAETWKTFILDLLKGTRVIRATAEGTNLLKSDFNELDMVKINIERKYWWGLKGNEKIFKKLYHNNVSIFNKPLISYSTIVIVIIVNKTITDKSTYFPKHHKLGIFSPLHYSHFHHFPPSTIYFHTRWACKLKQQHWQFFFLLASDRKSRGKLDFNNILDTHDIEWSVFLVSWECRVVSDVRKCLCIEYLKIILLNCEFASSYQHIP